MNPSPSRSSLRLYIPFSIPFIPLSCLQVGVVKVLVLVVLLGCQGPSPFVLAFIDFVDEVI